MNLNHIVIVSKKNINLYEINFLLILLISDIQNLIIVKKF